MSSQQLSPLVTCSTMGHENQRATRYVSCEGEGSYPYCDECADVLIRGGELDGGAVDDPVVVERDRYREAAVVFADYYDAICDSLKGTSHAYLTARGSLNQRYLAARALVTDLVENDA